MHPHLDIRFFFLFCLTMISFFFPCVFLCLCGLCVCVCVCHQHGTPKCSICFLSTHQNTIVFVEFTIRLRALKNAAQLVFFDPLPGTEASKLCACGTTGDTRDGCCCFFCYLIGPQATAQQDEIGVLRHQRERERECRGNRRCTPTARCQLPDSTKIDDLLRPHPPAGSPWELSVGQNMRLTF